MALSDQQNENDFSVNGRTNDISFSFGAAGWLHIYQLGAARALVDCKMAASAYYSGASSGALAATAAAAGASATTLDGIADFSTNCSEHYRESFLHLFCIRDYLQAAVRKFGAQILEQRKMNASERGVELLPISDFSANTSPTLASASITLVNDDDHLCRTDYGKPEWHDEISGLRATVGENLDCLPPSAALLSSRSVSAQATPIPYLTRNNSVKGMTPATTNSQTTLPAPLCSPPLAAPHCEGDNTIMEGNEQITMKTPTTVRPADEGGKEWELKGLFAKGRLKIYLTSLPWLRSIILDEFTTLDAVEEALCATCCLSPVAGLPIKVPSIGAWVVDGGIASLQPGAKEEQLRKENLLRLRKRLAQLTNTRSFMRRLLSSMFGILHASRDEAEEVRMLRDKIAKLEVSADFVAISPFYFSSADIRPSVSVPAWWALYPPPRQQQTFLYRLGHNDAIRYLEAKGYIEKGSVEELPLPSSTAALSPDRPIPSNVALGRWAAGIQRLLSLINFYFWIDFITDLSLTAFYLFFVRPIAMYWIYLELILVVALGCVSALWGMFMMMIKAKKWFATLVGEKLGSKFSRKSLRKQKFRAKDLDTEQQLDTGDLIDREFFSDVYHYGALVTILANLRSLVSLRQFLRLLLNTSFIPFNEVRLMAHSHLYRVLQPLVFEDNRPMFRWQWYQNALSRESRASRGSCEKSSSRRIRRSIVATNAKMSTSQDSSLPFENEAKRLAAIDDQLRRDGDKSKTDFRSDKVPLKYMFLNRGVDGRKRSASACSSTFPSRFIVETYMANQGKDNFDLRSDMRNGVTQMDRDEENRRRKYGQ